MSLKQSMEIILQDLYNDKRWEEWMIVKENLVKNTVDVQCKRCKGENIHVESKQVRSADEATTLFFQCLDCGFRWKE